MADFNYVVLDNGREKKGTVQANNEAEAKNQLKGRGYTVISVEKTNFMNKSLDLSIGGSVKPRDLAVFCRQFISMVEAGVTILETLEMLSEQTENKTMKQAIRGVYADIQKGETFADSLAKYPKVFPSIMVSMVAAGEASGKLEVAFDRMASHFEKSAKLKGLIRKSMMYPMVVAVVAVCVVIFFLWKIIPSFEDTYATLGAELPGITQLLMKMSQGLLNHWLIIIVVILAIVVFFIWFSRTLEGKKIFGKIAIHLPIFGKLNVKTASSNYARTLSTLIYSGLPMIDALQITARTMTNVWYKWALEKARDEVAKGVPLSEPIESSKKFPPMVYHMTRIGEETGDLEGMLNKLADYYDEEVEMATQTAMAALEPMIILVLAGIVGFLVAGIIAPMLGMYSALDQL